MSKIDLKKRTEFGTLKKIKWHPIALHLVRTFPEEIRAKIGYLLHLLQKGEDIQMPQSRPMSRIASGTFELRVKDREGIYRLFYLKKMDDGIYVIHAFQKKTEKTPDQEIRLARKRLKELME